MSDLYYSALSGISRSTWNPEFVEPFLNDRGIEREHSSSSYIPSPLVYREPPIYITSPTEKITRRMSADEYLKYIAPKEEEKDLTFCEKLCIPIYMCMCCIKK